MYRGVKVKQALLASVVCGGNSSLRSGCFTPKKEHQEPIVQRVPQNRSGEEKNPCKCQGWNLSSPHYL
jgi:hypothetical protein